MNGSIPASFEEIRTAALGMATLGAITLTLFALWGEYFKSYLDAEIKRDPRFDLAAERFKVKVASILVLLFQLTLFLGSYPVRKAYPFQSAFLFAGLFLLQSAVQTAIEKRFAHHDTQTKIKTPLEVAHSGVRGLFWLALFGALYTTCTLSGIAATLFLARVLHMTQIESAALVFLGAVAGIALGIAVNFGLAPQLLKNILPTKPIKDRVHHALIATLFAQCGLRVPHIFQIDLGKNKGGAVLVSGFHWGRGWFKPAIFISKSALEELTPSELTSVILHEVGHIALKHLRNRWALSSILILGLTSTAAFFVFACAIYFKDSPFQSFLGPIAGVTAFLIASYLISAQSRFQEIQADIYSAKRQNGDFSSLVSAIQKLEKMNPTRPAIHFLSMRTHPTIEMRIKVLEHYFASVKLMVGPTPAAQSAESKKKVA